MANLPPPPINDKPGSFTWLEWYRQLRNYVSTTGSVPWYIINFSGSNLTDIATRLHDNLQGLQGGISGQHYHITQDQHGSISNNIEVMDTTATQTLPTTPTVIKPPTVVTSNGISYNPTTGEFTILNGGSFSFTMMLNAKPSASNKTVYFYSSVDDGSGYVIRRYSGRSAVLSNTVDIQTLFSSSRYFAKGEKIKFYVWGDSATITLDTVDIPGTTPGTVTIPAVRILFAGSL